MVGCVTKVGETDYEWWDRVYHVSFSPLYFAHQLDISLTGGEMSVSQPCRYEKSMEMMDSLDPDRKYI